MNRRGFLKCAGLCLGVGAGCSRVFAGGGGERRPNIVLIVSDDHGTDALGCYGNTVIKTPHLDSLARDGVRFTNAFCTTASCSASRSVILSGMYNHATGQYGHEHSYHHFISFSNIRSLPVRLSEAGYRTARIGKYHVAPEEVYRFDAALPGGSRSPVRMAENCRDFISGGDEPFFLYFCTADPHRGGGTAEDLPGRPDLFGNRANGYPGVTEIEYEAKDVVVPAFLPDSAECRAELAQYYQSVSRLDQGVGRLMGVLRETGKSENTVVIYISDNGVAFPGAKTTLYEPGMRLPMIVRDPHNKKRGVTCDALVNYADLAPTILDFAGSSDVAGMHGRCFRKVIGSERAEGWDETYASHTFHEITMYYPMRVVRGRRYKLIWNIAYGLDYPFASDLWASSTWQGVLKRREKYYGKRAVAAYIRRAQFELYDLENDPDEVKNLAGEANCAKVLAEMKAKLKAFQKRTKDPWIVKWDYE